MKPNAIDPVCLMHGLPSSQHECFYCAVCYVDITPENAWTDPNGVTWDICKDCGDEELLLSQAKTLHARR